MKFVPEFELDLFQKKLLSHDTYFDSACISSVFRFHKSMIFTYVVINVC